uniref:Short transient receptor potential channel 4-like n=1 Tax=Saccoglossus kowalevskii TaxID=10224 RepID=A0ABM0MZH0_SACKO|nr:PREDICTED: short transient receptor potential channel 4-like [Saccoglossus kowalevskii]
MTLGIREDISEDGLRYRIYRAMSTPAYISLAYIDPVKAAFDLSTDIDSMAQSRNIEDTSQFVGHPKCQKIVKKEWLDRQPLWHTRNGWLWTILYGLYCVLVYECLMPILALIYIIAPCSPVTKILDNPKAKFIMDMFSCFNFLVLVIVLNIIIDSPGDVSSNTLYSRFLVTIFVYDIALLLKEIRQVVRHGGKAHFVNVLTYIDIIILVSFLVDIIMRFLMYNHVGNLLYMLLYKDLWTPGILILACIRFMHYIYNSLYLGSMLLLFTAMKDDVVRFLCIFAMVVLSFALGFYYMYVGVDKTAFNEFSSTVATLITVIFGADASTNLKVEVLYNTTGGKYDATRPFWVIGYWLYILFGTSTLVVLLNICIAMMSDTYARLKESIDMLWKFRRTQIWVDYFNAPVLPAPYNIIPSVSCVNALVASFCCTKERTIEGTTDTFQMNGGTYLRQEHSLKTPLTYDELMTVLLTRYVAETGIAKIKNFPTKTHPDFQMHFRQGHTLHNGYIQSSRNRAYMADIVLG